MIKYVTKTTKEYTYDEQGRIAKEVITEEYSEHNINEKENKPSSDYIKKAVGVPHTGTVNVPWKSVTTTSYDTSKFDTNSITHDNILSDLVLKTHPNTKGE